MDGKKHGTGVILFANGSQFTGQFQDDKRSTGLLRLGNCEYFVSFTGGDEIVQEYRVCCMLLSLLVGSKTKKCFFLNGRVIERYKDGSLINIKVEVVEGKFALTGAYTGSDGRTFQGEFKDSKMWGQGTCKYPNGDSFEGNFKNDFKSGSGVMNFAIGNVFTGQFDEDNKLKTGIFKITDYELDAVFSC